MTEAKGEIIMLTYHGNLIIKFILMATIITNNYSGLFLAFTSLSVAVSLHILYPATWYVRGQRPVILKHSGNFLITTKLTVSELLAFSHKQNFLLPNR